VTRPIEAGRVDYLASRRRYRLNGSLSGDVKQALRELELQQRLVRSVSVRAEAFSKDAF
jgi:hypothetical protein